MTTRLTKPVTREVGIKDELGNDGDIVATLTSDGITLRGKGTQRELKLDWKSIAVKAEAPSNMPVGFEDNKLGWLIQTAKKEHNIVGNATVNVGATAEVSQEHNIVGNATVNVGATAEVSQEHNIVEVNSSETAEDV